MQEKINTHLVSNDVCTINNNILIGSKSGNCILTVIKEGNDFYETLGDIESNSGKNIPKLGIGDRCYIKNAIVDKNCRIGNDVRINGGNHLTNADHSLYSVKDGIVVIKKGAVLTDGFII